MKKLYFLNRILLVLIFAFFFNCKENNKKKEANEKEQIKPFLKKPPKDDITFHIDTTKEYEYRTGTSGDYTYNYNAYGFDKNGNEVTGKITVNGKYGNGILFNLNNEEIDIDVEWIGKGKLLATDKDGNEYELSVDED
ncbi:hypothetical protein [Flavobacterium sp.]|uniref:hypothetical protein n=1 Tax=Flavobacterium sp. TaxID=239 RepID=UPI002FDE36E9